MKPIVEAWSIVVAGSWNPAIFSPKWVIGRLTDSKAINIEFSFGQPGLPPQLTFDGMKLRVSPLRLDLFPGNSDDDSLKRAQSTISKILTDLRHTPVSALGVNFKYIEESPSKELRQALICGDCNSLADAEWTVRQTTITRSLYRDNVLLNLILTEDNEGNILIDLNFHTDCADFDSAMKALEIDVPSLRIQGLDLLQNAYKLEIA